LFAQAMASNGIAGGEQLRALVFLVIAVTVLVEGLLAGPVARALGVLRPHRGYVILGANALGLALGECLRDGGHEVVFVDTNGTATGNAEKAGFKALWGSGADEGVLARAELDGRLGGIGTTTNEEVNNLFAQAGVQTFRVPTVYVGLQKGHPSLRIDDVREHARILYTGPVDLDRWALRLRRERAVRERWELTENLEGDGTLQVPDDLQSALLPLVVQRNKTAEPYHDRVRLKRSRQVWFAVNEEQGEAAREWLRGAGWTPAPPEVGADQAEEGASPRQPGADRAEPPS
jgi:hypothetical protein